MIVEYSLIFMHVLIFFATLIILFSITGMVMLYGFDIERKIVLWTLICMFVLIVLISLLILIFK